MFIEIQDVKYSPEDKELFLSLIVKTKYYTQNTSKPSDSLLFFVTEKNPNEMTPSTLTLNATELADMGISFVKPKNGDMISQEETLEGYLVKCYLDLSGITNNIDDNLNFIGIYYQLPITYPVETPCGLDKALFYAPIINDCNITSKLVCKAKDIIKDCDINMDFIYHYLLYKLFQNAISTKQWTEAIAAYNKFMKNKSKINNHGCGCK